MFWSRVSLASLWRTDSPPKGLEKKKTPSLTTKIGSMAKKPSKQWIFLILLWLRCLKVDTWENLVFLSPNWSQETLEFYFHIFSSCSKVVFHSNKASLSKLRRYFEHLKSWIWSSTTFICLYISSFICTKWPNVSLFNTFKFFLIKWSFLAIWERVDLKNLEPYHSLNSPFRSLCVSHIFSKWNGALNFFHYSKVSSNKGLWLEPFIG